ncbi:MAG: outer membrane beta-barrel protein [Bacteroidales bacterium]|nr:outer membrane beta-barrel protein [Bacteroidales bacterium]
MKKLSIILLLSVLCNTMVQAQGDYLEDKTEYRYPNFVLGLNHCFGSSIGGQTETLLIHYPGRGDVPQEKKGFSYTPGIQAGVLYNIDFKNNTTGVVVGGEIIDYGFQNKYKCTANSDYNRAEGDYMVKETFRSIGLQIPVMLKFSSSDIYRDMSYAYIGVKPTLNFMTSKGQKVSWSDEKFGKKLESGEKNTFSVAATFGFNYNIFSFNVNYMFMEFVNSKFEDEHGKSPYKGIKGHIYVCTSLNVPMTRWITIHNWTAEKIRRKLHNGKSL